MPVDNRNFIIEDLPDDPEDDNTVGPDEDDDMPIPPPRPDYQQQAPWQQRTTTPLGYPPPPSPTYWSRPWTPSFGQQYTPPNQPQPSQPTRYHQTSQSRIDRKKKIVFCDLLDVLIESESAVRETNNQGYMTSNNNYKRTGIMPRGLYDIRLKTEVWGKLAAFGADYVFCVTNQPEKSEEDLKTWKIMTDYVMYALADYLNLPHSNCRCFTKLGFDRSSEDTKPGVGLIKKALQSIDHYRYSRKDLVVVGVNSGYQNQPDIDRRMAKAAGVDYVDVGDLLTTYY